MANLEGTAPTEGATITLPPLCTTLYVKIKDDSANAALVNVPGIHAAGDYYPMDVGEEKYFRLAGMGIPSVQIVGVSGNATYKYTPVVVGTV